MLSQGSIQRDFPSLLAALAPRGESKLAEPIEAPGKGRRLSRSEGHFGGKLQQFYSIYFCETCCFGIDFLGGDRVIP